MAAKKFTVTDRLYVDAEGKIVPGDSGKAVALFSTPGKEIPLAEAEALGLVKPERKQADKPADKQRKVAPKNKSRKAKPKG